MKELTNLTLKEHTDLKRSGLMWVIFPDAMGDFRYDCGNAEPLIVSGDTWVCYAEGIDYLWMGNTSGSIPTFDKILKGWWKSFTGSNPDITELTDEIACLRPKIILNKEELFTLYGIESGKCVLFNFIRNQYLCRLATAHELQEYNKE